MLQTAGELDGGLPIVRSGILVGLIPAPDLEFALDNLRSEEDEMCLMAPKEDYPDNSSDDVSIRDPTDFSPYIDPVRTLIVSLSSSTKLLTCVVIGTCGTREAFAHGASLRMFRKVGSAIHVCSSGWTVCGSCKSTAFIRNKRCPIIITNTCCIVGSQKGVCKVFDGSPRRKIPLRAGV